LYEMVGAYRRANTHYGKAFDKWCLV